MLRGTLSLCMRRCAEALRPRFAGCVARLSSEASAQRGVAIGQKLECVDFENGGSSLTRPHFMHVGLVDSNLPFSAAHAEMERQIASELSRLSDYLMSANWGDSFALTTDSAFWDADLERLERQAAAFGESADVQRQLKETRRLFDCLRRTEDARDHLNEILELFSRSSGIGGVGLRASPSVSNVEDHADALKTLYKELLDEYSEFSSKIEESLGYGLALLRQKAKFDFPSQHEYFF